MFRALLILTACIGMAAVAAAEKTQLEKPVRTAVAKTDKTKVAGQMTAFDSESFTIRTSGDEEVEVKWSELDARTVFTTYAQLIQKSPADAWLELGSILLPMEEGDAWADKAFDRALKLDAASTERIAEIRKAAEVAKVQAEESAKASETDVTKDQEEPETRGDVQAQFWGPQPDERQAATVEELKAFAAETKKNVSPGLELFETRFFLFYSDIPAAEAKRWAGLLDRMYARLSELFGVPKDTNVWRGKALVFVFRTKEHYQKFQLVMHGTDPRWTAGMCHNFGDGRVHIAFYRQSNELDFAKVLVHESVHGYLHRYRSHPHVPSWANEGLAEVISSQLVKRPGYEQQARSDARSHIQQSGGLNRLFFDERIEPWGYPIAETLCEFMISQNKKGYVEFINGMKDGLSWEESLNAKYGTTLDRLIPAYTSWLGIRAR